MDRHESRIRLSNFSISGVDGSNTTNGLYANGRHQCLVIVDILKEVFDSNGIWASTVLTEEERASITVVEWSAQESSTLPPGWSCDEQKNIYSFGLWEKQATGNRISTPDVAHSNDSAVTERVRRYLRCDPDAAVGPRIFMAKAIVDGCLYTTNYSYDGVSFKSCVFVEPVRPFDLGVRDLVAYIDDKAFTYSGSPGFADVDVFYWVPPSGVRFLVNKGLDKPANLTGGGKDFHGVKSYVVAETIWWAMMGVPTNKNTVDAPLDAREIYPLVVLPVKNHPVVFDKYPTIMRAVKLDALEELPTGESQGYWRLLDNFGNEHKFILEKQPNKAGFLLKDALDEREFRLRHFEIKLPGGQPSTNALYANGRHQCKVLVEVAVDRQTSAGGWESVMLTPEERDSLSVTLYSSDMNPPLPNGWHCDNGKNQYDAGILGQLINEGDTRDENEHGKNAGIEVVERYMRCGTGGSGDPVRLMARIVVGGVVYTTNSVVNGRPYDSSVSITPTKPYVLRVADLNSYIDRDAFSDVYGKVYVYYWYPKGNLRFVETLGLDNPLSVPGEGDGFQTSHSKSWDSSSKRGYKFGVNKNHNLIAKLFMSSIYRWHAYGDNNIVEFSRIATPMRAVWLETKADLVVSENSKSRWRLWDNFGCEHVFWLDTEGLYYPKLMDG